MRLLRIRLRHVGPFDDTTIPFGEEAAHEDAERPAGDLGPEPVVVAAPRPVTVLFGGSGVGKTSLLAALSVTRPGYAVPPSPQPTRVRSPDEPPHVVTEWLLGEDDPERPHPLVVASPTAVLPAEPQDAAVARRREQALFDRKAQGEGGFVFVGFSGARWFSRTHATLSTPERSILRYDVRAPTGFDDPTRADLTRETKQVLAYAAIARALAGDRAEHVQLTRFDEALRRTVDILLEPFGLTYVGVSPLTLEPEAREGSRVVPFDALPRPARHLVSFGALTVRALFAAYPGAEDPREREGVVAVDDVDAQQDPAMLRGLVPLLRRTLPNVQWILTTASTQLANACAPGEVVALRRTDERVEASEGLLH